MIQSERELIFKKMKMMDRLLLELGNALIEGFDRIVFNRESNLQISSKGSQDIVTNLDFEIERFVKTKVQRLFPEDQFIGEEENQGVLSEERTWVLDPIDGTLNFSRELPYYGSQLTLFEGGKARAAMIYLPALSEFYLAVKGKGAYLNGDRILADKQRTLEESIITYGDFSKSNPTSRPKQIQSMSQVMEVAAKVRIQGASSIDFAFVASGRTGGHIMFSKRLWEFSAGILLCEEAECITDFDGVGEYLLETGGVIVAQNEMILSQLAKTISSSRSEEDDFGL